MSIYEEINEQLEDETLDAAHIAAIRSQIPDGCWAILDDGNEVMLSYGDYWVLNNNIAKLYAEHQRLNAPPVEKTHSVVHRTYW